jgi:uncharacterized protein YdeI (YjbR/CyaY-like superfamily)
MENIFLEKKHLPMSKEIETFCPKSRTDWREWLEKNHQSKQSIWLVYFRVSTKIPSLSWSEAVDEALCFGWIDSTKKTNHKERYMKYFTKRKPNSTWSKVNKDKIENLTENNLMTKAGFDSIETAKQNGTWTLMDGVENLIIPEDLKIALNENSMDFFQRQSKSIQKQLLYWVVIAKRTETRKKRIAEIAESAAEGMKPKQFK